VDEELDEDENEDLDEDEEDRTHCDHNGQRVAHVTKSQKLERPLNMIEIEIEIRTCKNFNA